MIIFIVVIVVIAIVAGIFVSKHRFNARIGNISKTADTVKNESIQLSEELSRIDELKKNLVIVQRNIESLDIPLPEQISNVDTTQTALNKLSQFCENHNKFVVGTEQFILSVVPVHQIGVSLKAMYDVLPPDLGHNIFGDAISSIKDGIQTESVTDLLGKFVHGATHLGSQACRSMAASFEHHNYFSAAFTPLKAGLIEATGLGEAGHNIAQSLHDLGGDMINAAESATSISDLSSSADVDLTGHVPVITIALSSFREYQLLAANKTNVFVSLKNITLDAVGTWSGAVIGTIIGMVVTIYLGPASVIGGIIGAIIGSIFGRSITNKIKLRPLKKAIEKYEVNYKQMKTETETYSKNALNSVHKMVLKKREEFKNARLLHETPIADPSNVVSLMALSIYKCIVDETLKMKSTAKQLRDSIWFSKKKHEEIISTYEKTAEYMLKQMPESNIVQNNHLAALDVLLHLDIPTFSEHEAYQMRVAECRKELKELNDKNDSSLLMWSYMVNNLYHQTLNDIATYSNEQMKSLDRFFKEWQQKIDKLVAKVEKEKGRLGLA